MSTGTPLADEVLAQLRQVIDPELGIDIISLGLVYKIRIDDDNSVHIVMTLTVPGCPMHATITADVENALRRLPWVTGCDVIVTFDPPWVPERMSDEAKAALAR